MKKVLLVILGLILLSGVFGCGGNTNTPAPAPAPPAPVLEPTPVPEKKPVEEKLEKEAEEIEVTPSNIDISLDTDNDKIKGELTSVTVVEVLSTTEFEFVAAQLSPASATTVISDHWRFDINNDGKINLGDIALIIYNYYLSQEGGAKWNVAKYFDASGDGIIDMADLLIICTYFTA